MILEKDLKVDMYLQNTVRLYSVPKVFNKNNLIPDGNIDVFVCPGIEHINNIIRPPLWEIPSVYYLPPRTIPGEVYF